MFALYKASSQIAMVEYSPSFFQGRCITKSPVNKCSFLFFFFPCITNHSDNALWTQKAYIWVPAQWKRRKKKNKTQHYFSENWIRLRVSWNCQKREECLIWMLFIILVLSKRKMNNYQISLVKTYIVVELWPMIYMPKSQNS